MFAYLHEPCWASTACGHVWTCPDCVRVAPNADLVSLQCRFVTHQAMARAFLSMLLATLLVSSQGFLQKTILLCTACTT